VPGRRLVELSVRCQCLFRTSHTSEVATISDPTTPTDGTGRSRRVNLGIFGHQTVGNLIGAIGLLIATASAFIAYFDWQGNVAERGAKGAPASSASSATPRPSTETSPTSPAPELSYQLTAAPVDSQTVKVTAKASGQPRPGLTYWFVLEVNWGGGNLDYYPRRTLTDSSTSFEVTIPPDADPSYPRQGRVYALNSAQNTQAEAKLEAQSTTREDDFFDNATGQTASNAVKLPY
jgi:hypothetical protein